MGVSTSNRPRALMVDDDVTTSPVYLRRLTDEGYQVTTANDPALALTLAKESPPSIIFVHLGRGGSGCSAFIVALRAGDDTRHIPVAVLSHYYNPNLERIGLTAVVAENW